jgi:hypothetical protein
MELPSDPHTIVHSRATFMNTSPMPTSVDLQRYLAYGCASLIGLLLAFWIFPVDLMLAKHSRDLAVSGDVAQHIAGQRYFISDGWHWPLLRTTLLNMPDGLNIAFTDSIPLLALPAKLLRTFLPTSFHTIYLWLGLAYTLQPLAAVYALRSAGERRLVPAIVIAVIAISMPAFLYRINHAALCGHFLILLALGVYFQICSGRTCAIFGYTTGLLVISLLVHPYLMAMVAAVLVAAPISLLVRRDRTWRRATVGLLAALTITGLTAEMLGYGGTVPLSGFGVFSMNLLSPFYPDHSALLPGFSRSPDATGGQYEGYNYLGLGVLLLMVCCVLLPAVGRPVPIFLPVHAGLVSVCLGLTLLAMSNRGYVGHYELYNLGPVPSLIGQFRGSGRLFWPVGYVIMIGTVLMMARWGRPALGATALVVAAGLQFADARLLRDLNHNSMHTRPDWTINTVRLRPLLASHQRLNIFPVLGCGVDAGFPGLLQLLLLASEYSIPINMMHVARTTEAPSCGQANTYPLQAGELRIYLHRAFAFASENNRNCRMLNQDMSVCSTSSQFLVGLPEVPPVIMPVGRRIDTQSGGSQAFMTVGWSISEAGGTWTEGNTAILTGRLGEPLQPGSELIVWCRSLTPKPGGQQQVTVLANDQQIGVWSVPEDHDVVERAKLPVHISTGQKLTIRFQVGQPVRPIDRKLSSDDRQLGLWLSAFELQPASAVPASSPAAWP